MWSPHTITPTSFFKAAKTCHRQHAQFASRSPTADSQSRCLSVVETDPTAQGSRPSSKRRGWVGGSHPCELRLHCKAVTTDTIVAIVTHASTLLSNLSTATAWLAEYKDTTSDMIWCFTFAKQEPKPSIDI
jgi:hypothetical protein